MSALPTVVFPENVSMTGRYPTFLAQAAMERGPILKLFLESGRDLVFMVGPEANRFVLHTHREHFSHEQGWTPVLGDWFGHGLLNMDPPEHTRHRRLMNPAFTASFLAMYLPIMHRVVAARTADWAERGEVDLYEEAREIAFDVAAGALAGLHGGAGIDQMRQLFYGLLHGFDPTRESWPEFEARQNRMNDELNALLLPLIQRRRAGAEPPRDVIGMIVAARDEAGRLFSDEQVLAHLKILLVAGHETTTTLGAWTLYQLASRPSDRTRVLAELDGTATPRERPLSGEALRALRFLDSFVKEVGRLYSPVVQVPRGVLKEFEFGGYAIPPGAEVRLSLSAGHRLSRAFADPERFDPERFEPPREEDKRTPYSLVTFGGGPRVCIGMSFAQLEVKALVAHVLRRLILSPIPDRTPVHAGYWTAIAPEGVPVLVAPA
jgi:cytochrome P450